MDAQELLVAEAAVNASRHKTFDELEVFISETTGFSKHDVAAIVKRLVAEGYLHILSGPVANLAAGELPAPPVNGWYEKGSMWK